MAKDRVRKSNKKSTDSTKIIRKLRTKIEDLEIEIKRLRLEFSWYQDKNDYLHCLVDEKIDHLDKQTIPF